MFSITHRKLYSYRLSDFLKIELSRYLSGFFYQLKYYYRNQIYLLRGSVVLLFHWRDNIILKVSLHLCKLDLQTKLSYISNHFLENSQCLRWLTRLKFRFISSFKFGEQICKLNSYKYSLFGEQMSWTINYIIIQTRLVFII